MVAPPPGSGVALPGHGPPPGTVAISGPPGTISLLAPPPPSIAMSPMFHPMMMAGAVTAPLQLAPPGTAPPQLQQVQPPQPSTSSLDQQYDKEEGELREDDSATEDEGGRRRH